MSTGSWPRRRCAEAVPRDDAWALSRPRDGAGAVPRDGAWALSRPRDDAGAETRRASHGGLKIGRRSASARWVVRAKTADLTLLHALRQMLRKMLNLKGTDHQDIAAHVETQAK